MKRITNQYNNLLL